MMGTRVRSISPLLKDTSLEDLVPQDNFYRRLEGRLGYRAHYVVDGGNARVILNVLVTPADVTENQPMLDVLWRTSFRWRARVRRVTGDAKYGTRENVAAVEKAGVRAYVSMADFEKKSRVPGRCHHARWSELRGLAQSQRGEEPRRLQVAAIRTKDDQRNSYLTVSLKAKGRFRCDGEASAARSEQVGRRIP